MSVLLKLAAPFVLGALALVAAIGCSTEASGTGGAGGASDGKLHPKANGTAIDEATACDTLHQALETRVTQLSCVITLPTCPSLVQTVAGKACAQFDQGTINGCAAYFSAASDCADMSKRSQGCVFEAIANSAPKGCPGQ